MENVGELRAGLVAKRMGLKQVDSHVKSGVHGIDAIFQKGNRFFIVEAKGGTSRLAKQQMSKAWITQNIKGLDDPLRSQLQKARNEGNLFGMVTKTPIDKATGVVLDPTYTIKHFDQIGGRAY